MIKIYLECLQNPQSEDERRLAEEGLRRLSKPRISSGGISPERIQAAKEYPIAQLLGKYPKCPFHPDKRPSTKIHKDNILHCFTCNKQWDAIDVCRKVKGLDFKSAVDYLNQ